MSDKCKHEVKIQHRTYKEYQCEHCRELFSGAELAVHTSDIIKDLEAKVSELTIKSRVVAECEQEYRDLYKFLQIWFEKLGLSIPDDDALLQWGDNLDEVDLLKRKEAQK